MSPTPRLSKAAAKMAADISNIGIGLDQLGRLNALNTEISRLMWEREHPLTEYTVAICDMRIAACRKAGRPSWSR